MVTGLRGLGQCKQTIVNYIKVMAFISNPDEEAKLNSDEHQNQLADALLRGIEGYFAKNPPLARNWAV